MALPLWRGVFLLALLLLGYVFWPTLVSLHERWVQFSHSLSHGYLLVGVTIFLCWQLRGNLGGSWRPTAWLAVPLLVGASLFWFAGYATQLTLAQQLAIPALLWLCLVVAFGWRAGWQLVIPIGILYFGIPVWDVLVEPLQAVTVYVTQSLLSLLQIPAHVQGFYIEVPTGSFEVAGGCSGLNYLLVGSVIGILHAYLNISSWRRRAAALGLILALALLSNWIRVFSLVLIGYLTHMESELIDDHDGFGWIIFAGALVLFFLLSRWFIDEKSAPPSRTQRASIDWALATPRLWLAVIIAIAVPLWAQWYDARLAADEKPGLPLLPASVAMPASPGWMPAFQGYDVAQNWRLAITEHPAELVALTWHTQERDRKLIYYANRIATDGRQVATLPPLASGDLRLNRTVIRDGVSTRLVWWAYLIGDAVATGNMEAKLRQLPAWLSGDPRAALVALSIRCRSTACTSEADDALLQEAAARAMAESLAVWRSEPG